MTPSMLSESQASTEPKPAGLSVELHGGTFVADLPRLYRSLFENSYADALRKMEAIPPALLVSCESVTATRKPKAAKLRAGNLFLLTM